jgi:hypothetical protein
MLQHHGQWCSVLTTTKGSMVEWCSAVTLGSFLASVHWEWSVALCKGNHARLFNHARLGRMQLCTGQSKWACLVCSSPSLRLSNCRLQQCFFVLPCMSLLSSLYANDNFLPSRSMLACMDSLGVCVLDVIAPYIDHLYICM